MQPNLFLAGTPKAATSSLAHWLSQHPAIFVPHVKEPRFYNDDRSNSAYVGRRARYEGLFPERPGIRYYCDATPDYLYSPNAIEGIARDTANARLLVTFRDYADSFVSLHQQERFIGVETIDDPEAAFHACSDRRVRHRTKPDRAGKSLYYDERLRIGAQLWRALEYVDRSGVCLVDFDLFRTAPDTVWEGVTAFLDLPPHPIEYSKVNVRKAAPSGMAAGVLSLGMAVKRKLGLRGGTGLGTRLRTAASEEDSTPPIVSDAFRAKLTDRFRHDRMLVEAFARSGPAIVGEGFYTKAPTDLEIDPK